MSLAKGALQQDQIRSLITINNEAKVRRSTKSMVLGNAKVMSYENLVTKRAEREPKRTNQSEAGAPEPKAKVARMSEAPIPWRAPSGAELVAEDAEDETTAQGMELASMVRGRLARASCPVPAQSISNYQRIGQCRTFSAMVVRTGE